MTNKALCNALIDSVTLFSFTGTDPASPGICASRVSRVL